jgi:hypothetical protein
VEDFERVLALLFGKLLEQLTWEGVLEALCHSNTKLNGKS